MIEPVLIEPEAIYDDGSLRQALGLTENTLANARRVGTLRYTRRGKRTLYFGRWIIEWLQREGYVEQRPARAEGVA